MFLGAYSGLFWAEKSVPSGVAAVLVASIPLWTILLEAFVFRTQKLQQHLVVAIVLGLTGVAVLAAPSGGGSVKLLPCLAILGSEISWSFGTVASKQMQLPASRVMTAAAQMLTGGAMLLFVSATVGEFHPVPHFPPQAVLALVYLIVAGSLLAFTAFVWLLGRMPAVTVSSYAYVNPVIALLLGHWLGRESLGWHTLLGAGFVLGSVITIMKKQKAGKA
jgi:drug/metabolite transporter (DMT)-like permease